MKVLILAGVGDHTGYISRRTRHWKEKYGLTPIIYPVGWKGDYATNYQNVKNRIINEAAGAKFALIGISAGASLAIRLASELPNAACVTTVCGRTSRGGFQLSRLKSYTAYWQSVDWLEANTPKVRLMVVKPLYDEVTAVSHMDYPDALVVRTLDILHIPSIFSIISKQSDRIAQFISNDR